MSTARVPSPSGQRARPRAPTITIDTSAVATPAAPEHHIALSPLSNTSFAAQAESKSGSTLFNSSSPLTSNSSHFLSVPARSRGDSVDSDSGQSSSSVGGATDLTSASACSDRSSPGSGGDSANDILKDEEALKPDPGTEADFVVEDNKFAFSPGQLSKLLSPKSLSAFHAIGGLTGLKRGLRTDLKSGLNADEEYLTGKVSFDEARHAPTAATIEGNPAHNLARQDTSQVIDASKRPTSFADRKRVFKDNRLPIKKTKNIFQLMWTTYNDKVLILLSIAAVVSLALGLYQSFGQSHPNGEAPIEWVEGVAIMVAIIIVVLVGSLNDYQKEQQFAKLNKKKDDRRVKVTRSGKVQELSVYDVLVGDIVIMEAGDMIPVDGIFIDGHNIKCDESSATGESDIIKKYPGHAVFKAIESNEIVKKMDPFILSGSKVTEGVGTFLVTAVGVNSTFGKTLMSLRDEAEVTPLQSKLNTLAENIAKLGGAAALLYFVIAFIEFLVDITTGNSAHLPSAMKGQAFLQIFILAVSIIVVAVPEGLPLAVTLALAFATTRMMKDNNLVRLLRSCEIMGNATTVCSDKTGTLTQNVMTVVAGTLGMKVSFGGRVDNGVDGTGQAPEGVNPPQKKTISPNQLAANLHADVISLLIQSIAVNSTAFEGEEDGKPAFVGSKTETALLGFAHNHLGMGPVGLERDSADIVQLIPFDSSRKCMAVVIKMRQNHYRLHVKGASEILLGQCTRIVSNPSVGISQEDLPTNEVAMLNTTITSYADRSLRTIALCFRDFERWPPRGARKQEDDRTRVLFDDLFKELTFLGVVGIQDPLRPGVAEAVNDFKKAGVVVRMVTGDNVQTARAIATECGIYTSGGLVMEGPDFHRLSRQDMDQVIPRLQVLARSSPEDKRILVKRLKALGETVASTGDGTNDAPALKAADVGFTMGIAGTEVAKEAAGIILMDDNFASIVKALLWGRAVNDAVKKFLQFQLTVNITAVITTIVSGVSNSEGRSVLTAVQLLWVNLIMDTFAALALATDPPSKSMLDRKPDRKDARLITLTMWKMIIGQAIYQLVVIFILYYAGNAIFNYRDPEQDLQLTTLTFNAYVWMQIFGAFNSRRLDNRFNIFEGIFRNWFFIGILLIMIGGQILIVFVGGAALTVTRLNGAQWGYSIAIGALTLPIGVLIRLIPDAWVAACVPHWLRRKTKPKFVIEDEEAQVHDWNPAAKEIRQELAFLMKYKGGRLGNLRFKLQNPREFLPPRSSSSQITRSRSSTMESASSLPRTPVDEQAEHTALGRSAPPSPSGGPPKKSPSTRSKGRARAGSALAPAMAAAGIMAGSIGGFSPIERRPGSNPFREGDQLDTAVASTHTRNRSDQRVSQSRET